MIFSPKLARRIAEGRKTQTRRSITRTTVKLKDGTRIEKPAYYRVNHDYPVTPGRGRHALFRIKVTAIRTEPVGQITLQDARAEGFRTTSEFKIHWVRLHDRAWIDRHKVDLAAVFDDEHSVVDWILLERFRLAHAHKPVRVITFEPLQDAARFLASQRDVLTGRSDGDYTANRNRAIDDLEVIGDQDHKRLHEHAGARDHARRREPLATGVENLKATLDALREQITDEGIQDARLRKALDRVEYHAEQAAKRLAA